MAIDLRELVKPRDTAVLCMEMQNGIVGPQGSLPALAEAVRATGMLSSLAGLLSAARSAGIPVVYCTLVYRADRRGSAANAPRLARSFKQDAQRLVAGTQSARVIDDIAPQPQDLIAERCNGMSPFSGTSLDIALRNMGIRTIIATGVSLNIGIFGMAVEAVGLGYNVVVARDCVTGLPLDYAEAVLNNSLSMLATISGSSEIKAAWPKGGASSA
jgi:nicotinamidase-related amidase